MTQISRLLGAALVGVAVASKSPPLPGRASKIKWALCDDSLSSLSGLPIECANLTVPLDYADPESGQTLKLPLLRVPAVKQPAKGSIIFHSGGPGFDLVSWDQRGTADVMSFLCYNSSADRWLSPIYRMNVDNMPGGAMDRRDWALGALAAQNCYEFVRDKRRAVRDLMQLVAALAGDNMLRFWGYSYGTVMGPTAAAMFPDKIERMVLDGVVNLHGWYQGTYPEHLFDADKVFSAFLRTCFERPRLCDLAKHNPNATVAQIEREVYNLIDTFRSHPVALVSNATLKNNLLDQNFIRAMILPRLYLPTLYPELASLLHILLCGDVVAFTDAHVAALDNVSFYWMSGARDDASMGIHCLDQAFRTNSLHEASPLIRDLTRRSRLFGRWASSIISVCAQWRLPAKERFTRGFHEPVYTKHPLLVIGNEYGVATPFVSARNATASFPGSALLKFNAHGHCTLQQPSLCTARAIRAYFEDGELPADGALCEATEHPWDPQSWRDLYLELGYEMKGGAE